jgi:hypothetical protein
MPMRIPVASTFVAVIAGITLLTWNGSRFLHAEARIRTKDLTFLPSPTVAKVLCLGHANSFAKLRWIDSFAYFQKQLDVKDDTIAASGESTYKRLYHMLLALDPKFLPFYEHLSLVLGGVLNHHGTAFGFLNGGLLELPHETKLWRMIAAEMSTMTKAGEANTLGSLDAFLSAWSESESTPEGRQMVWDWKKAMGQRRFQDLEQLPYWIEQLHRATPGTPTYDFVLRTLREQVARFGEGRLALLVTAYRERYWIPPVTIDDLLQPEVVRKAFPRGLPSLAPLRQELGGYVLKQDPFGFPYQLQAGQPISVGWQQVRETKRAALMSAGLAKIAQKEGRWPTTVAEARAAGLELDVLPPGGWWSIEGQIVSLHWPEAPFPAWVP